MDVLYVQKLFYLLARSEFQLYINLILSTAYLYFAGPGLAFVAYPESLSKMPLPQLWAALFFLTLITVAFDSTVRYFLSQYTIQNFFISVYNPKKNKVFFFLKKQKQLLKTKIKIWPVILKVKSEEKKIKQTNTCIYTRSHVKSF